MALSGLEFWTQLLTLLEGGTMTSDPNYYLPQQGGDAQVGDWANVAKVLLERLAPGTAERKQAIDLLVQSGMLQESEASWWYIANADNAGNINDLTAAAEQRLPGMFGPSGVPAAEDPNATAPGAPAEETQADASVGGTGPSPQLTILYGKEMKWYFDPSSGKWMVSYGLPNSDREMVFEAEPDQMDALFGVGYRPTNFERVDLGTLTARTNITFGGSIAEMEGKGTFEGEYDRIVALALDEGTLPTWMQGDAAAMDIIFIAQAEGKSDDWAIEQFSKLTSFITRFPGLDAIKAAGNLSTAEAVEGFLQFEAGVRALSKEYGLSEALVTPQVVGGLINGGYSLTFVRDVFNATKRLQDYAPALTAFNEILAANGEAPLTSTQAIDFMLGRAPAKIYDIWEASSFRESAVAAGLGDLFSADDAIAAALQTPGMLTPQQASSGMQKAAEMLLRLRNEVNLEQFGLTHEELIDINLGTVPRSGRTQAEIWDGINRAVSTAKAQIEGMGTRPYTGFSDEGAPQTASLSRLRPS